MTRLTLIIISFFIISNVQGQKQQGNFSELFADLECLSNIVEKGLKNQTWDLKQLMEKKDSCENYMAVRRFELKTDTLIITRKEKQENFNLRESRLTIENDSMVVAKFFLNEPIDFSKGKVGKLLTKEELEELPGFISIRFIYNGHNMQVDFFPGL
ncbi:MAG: hypothetical protein JXR50_01610 [Prolixibacteraceae bacterium]|nr:hypothetical protein [Prolixibacteraceae bacterium]